MIRLGKSFLKFDSQTLKMISQVESFLCQYKQGTPEEGPRIQRLKRCVTSNNNKDEDKCPKNHTQNIAHQTSSKRFRQIKNFFISILILASKDLYGVGDHVGA